MLRRCNLIIGTRASEQACCHILLPTSREAWLESPLRSNYKIIKLVARLAREATVRSWDKSGTSLGKTGQSKMTLLYLQYGLLWKHKLLMIFSFLIQKRANGSLYTNSHQLCLMSRDKQLNPTHQRKTMSCPKWNLAKERPNWALVPVLGFAVLPQLLTHCVTECLRISERTVEHRVDNEWKWLQSIVKMLKGPKCVLRG